MRKIEDNNKINPDPYEDIVRLEKLDPYESLINSNALVKQKKKFLNNK